jgi:uncharacterized membrane protein
MSKEQSFTLSKALDNVNRHRKRSFPVFVVTFCALEGALVKASFSAGLREFLMWSVVALALTVCFVGFAVVFQMTRMTLKILKAIEVISKA